MVALIIGLTIGIPCFLFILCVSLGYCLKQRKIARLRRDAQARNENQNTSISVVIQPPVTQARQPSTSIYSGANELQPLETMENDQEPYSIVTIIPINPNTPNVGQSTQARNIVNFNESNRAQLHQSNPVNSVPRPYQPPFAFHENESNFVTDPYIPPILDIYVDKGEANK